MNHVIGIDNGVSGALVHLNREGNIIGSLCMPVQKTRKGNEVNVSEVWRWLKVATYGVDCTVCIEEPGGSKSAKAASSMAGSFHALRACIEIMGLRCVRITPQAWQRPTLRCRAGNTKPVALQMAKSLWPGYDFKRTGRCTKDNDGLVDAALIARYAQLNNL